MDTLRKNWHLGLLVTPFILGSFFSNMVYAKVIFIQVLVLIGLILTFTNSIKLNKTLISVFGLLLFSLLSYFWASDSNLLFFSQYWRGTGFFFYLTLFALLLTLSSFEESSKKRTEYLIIAVGSLNAFTILINSLFLKINPNRLFTGNINAASFLVFIGLFFCVKNWEKLSEKLKLLPHSIASFSILSLFFSGSRSNILALIICATSYFLLMKKERIKQFLLASLGVGLIFIAILFTNQNLLTSLLKRTKDFTRLTIWEGSLNAFLAKPILGWGFQGLYEGFWHHYPKGVASRITWIENAHSLPINILSELGLIGFALFCAVIFFLSKELLRKEGEEKAIWTILWGYLFFFLLVQPAYIEVSLFLALIYALFSSEKEMELPALFQKGGCAATILLIGFITMAQFKNNLIIKDARIAIATGKDYRPIWKNFSVSPFYLDPLSSNLELIGQIHSLYKRATTDGDKRIFSGLALKELNKIKNKSKHRPRFHEHYALWQMRANDFSGADSTLSTLLEKSENISSILRLKGETKIKLGDSSAALSFFEKAHDLTPRDIRLKMNLAKMYFDLGYRSKAVEKVNEASEIDPTNRQVQSILNQMR